MNVMDLERANGDAISGEGTYPLGSTTPYLEWAVMKDPFGNAFCPIKDLDQKLRDMRPERLQMGGDLCIAEP